MTTKELMEIQTAMRNGDRLTDAQVGKVAELRRKENLGSHWVEVSKIDLRPGEELWDFASALATAAFSNRVLLADGSLDMWVYGIYDDHIVVQDWNTGKFFKAAYTRNADGEFEFGEPEEVMMTFVPMPGSDEVSKSRKPDRLNLGRVQRKWSGVLPRRF